MEARPLGLGAPCDEEAAECGDCSGPDGAELME